MHDFSDQWYCWLPGEIMDVLNEVKRPLRFVKRSLQSLKGRVCSPGVRAPDVRSPAGAALSYGQAGEDRILSFLFGSLGIRQPSYVDIGAHHPILCNSTYLFYLQGSQGVCVEPNPDLAALLRTHRPRDVIVEAGIVPTANSTLMYHMFRESTLNTFSPEEADIRIRYGGAGGNPVKVVEVATLTLDELMLNYCSQGLDLLAIDVEGLDEALLTQSQLPIRPKLIMVETVPFSNRHPVVKRMQVVEVLKKKGYQVVADSYVNTVFVDESIVSVAEV